MILDDSQILIYLFLDKLQYISTILFDLFMLNNDSEMLLYVFFLLACFCPVLIINYYITFVTFVLVCLYGCSLML